MRGWLAASDSQSVCEGLAASDSQCVCEGLAGS